MKKHYSFEDIKSAYSALGLVKNDIIYLTGNLGSLGFYGAKEETLKAHVDAVLSIIGDSGTIVVPTHTFRFCNTDNIFNYLTAESETGPLTEYIRTLPGAVRQFHPFSSSTAYGFQAQYLCSNNSRHVYGMHSPFERMIEQNAKFLSIGLPARFTASIIHHLEFIAGVPYRFTKGFQQRCMLTNQVETLTFYLFVLYRNNDLIRDKNKKIFNIFYQKYDQTRVKLGLSFVEIFSMKKFADHISKALIKDPYLWLKTKPKLEFF